MAIKRIYVFKPCRASRFSVEVLHTAKDRTTIAENRSLDDAQDVANQRKEDLEALGHTVYLILDTRG